MTFVNSTAARILAVLLLIQAAAYYAVASRTEYSPANTPLSSFPAAIQDWRVGRDMPLEKEVSDLLNADDTLNRIYVNPQGVGASLFIAFFRTQRYGQAPHSPKNCLPGNGWQYKVDSKVAVAVPGRDTPIVINKYVIARGEDQSVVLYWYHSHKRVIAGELSAKFWLVADAIRYRRSDTALVRVIVPVRNNAQADAEKSAIAFVQAVFPDVSRQFPQ